MTLEVFFPQPLPVAGILDGPDLTALERLHAALPGATARERAALLLTLGGLHLRRGEGGLAARWFDEGLAVTRAQRLARPLRAALLLGVSTAARLQGEFGRAEAHAGAALRATSDERTHVAALLAQAAARRLSGDAWGSLMPTHAALGRAQTPETRVAHTLAWLTLAPAETAGPAGTLAGEVGGMLRARLAWFLAEGALGAGHAVEADRWLAVAARSPFAAEEARLCPGAAARQGVSPPAGAGERAVQVLTLERQGLQAGTRFLPVPGDGRPLALLAFLIDGGPTHWERAADAVLGDGERAALYGQVRHHLSTVRGLLGDPGAVTSRRGILTLDAGLHWSCDALEPGTGGGRAWLPLLRGWWVEERRAQLASRA